MNEPLLPECFFFYPSISVRVTNSNEKEKKTKIASANRNNKHNSSHVTPATPHTPANEDTVPDPALCSIPDPYRTRYSASA